MHYCKSSISLVALAVALICLAQMTPRASALCTIEDLKSKAALICGANILTAIPCKLATDKLLDQIDAICSIGNNNNQPTTAAPPAAGDLTKA